MRSFSWLLIGCMVCAGVVACSTDELDTPRANVRENVPDASRAVPDASLILKDMALAQDISTHPDASAQSMEDFAGYWILYDNSVRNGMSQSLYHFDASGTLEQVSTFDQRMGGVFCDKTQETCPWGSTPQGQSEGRCKLGERWELLAKDRVQVVLECSDGQERRAVIELGADGPKSGPWLPGGRIATIVAVDGAPTSAWSLWTYRGALPLLASCTEEPASHWDPCKDVRGN